MPVFLIATGCAGRVDGESTAAGGSCAGRLTSTIPLVGGSCWAAAAFALRCCCEAATCCGRATGRTPFPSHGREAAIARRANRNIPITVTSAAREWFGERTEVWAGRSIGRRLEWSKLALRHWLAGV